MEAKTKAKNEIPEHQAPKETNYYEKEKYGVMYATDYEWSNTECTRRAYGKRGDGRSLLFHTDLLNKEEALECIKEIPHYNAFDPENVSKQLEKMPHGTKIAVGREGSPVLYIWTDDIKRLTELFVELDVQNPSSGKWCNGPDEYAICPAEKFPHVIGDLLDPIRNRKNLDKIVKKAEDADGDKVLVRAWWD